MLDSDSDLEDTNTDLFEDPPDFYPPSPKPTFATHRLLSGTELSLRLVGHNPLWGHHLWNAGRIISHYLEKNPLIIQGNTVLELGAGGGLPSLISGILGAKKVVATDYPDVDLIQNLQFNIDNCPLLKKEEEKIVAEGYLWGADPAPLLEYLPEDVSPKDSGSKGFDVLILADLLFNHSEHQKLLSTISLTLRPTSTSLLTRDHKYEPRALIFFTPYRPWLFEKDMAFFDLCRAEGYVVDKILEEKMDKVMFEEDRGDEELRRTVFGYLVRRKRDGEVVEGLGQISKKDGMSEEAEKRSN